MVRQPVLPFSPRIAEPTPYQPSSSQQEAAALLPRLLAAATRPRGLTAILLKGPQGSGKSRLLEEAAFGQGLDFEVVAAHETGPMELFAEINRSAAAGQALLIEARGSIAKLYSKDDLPPDLHSRLSSLPQIRLEHPTETELASALRLDLILHGQALKPKDMALATAELPRNFAAVRLFCRALDRAPSEGTAAQRLRWAIERAQQLIG
jgi:chromosomal replication initiation ATPase DnaA